MKEQFHDSTRANKDRNFIQPPRTVGAKFFNPFMNIKLEPAVKVSQEQQQSIATINDTCEILSDVPPLRITNEASKKKETILRRDRRGRSIDKTRKRYHVTFRDNIMGNDVADVNEVESYKKYNKTWQEDKNECRCLVL